MEHSIWTDKRAQRRMEKLIKDDVKHGDICLILDINPGCIMISLTCSKTHKPRSKHTLPEDFNFLQDKTSNMIVIPISYGQDKNLLIVGSNKTKIFYNDHPLELGFALTVWKVQSLTFDKVIL